MSKPKGTLEKNGRGWIDTGTGNLVDRTRRGYRVIFADGRAKECRTMACAREAAAWWASEVAAYFDGLEPRYPVGGSPASARR